MRITKIFLSGLVLVLFSCSSNDSSVSAVSKTYKIFVTAGDHTGSVGGVTAVDAICMADTNKPADTSTYKALLGSSTRQAPSTDWPLKASTTYVRADGTTVIGITTAGSVFSFPLTNAIDPSVFNVWTGLNPDWSPDTNNCSEWTSAASGVAAGSGLAEDTSDLSIGAGDSLNCASTIAFYCVEQ